MSEQVLRLFVSSPSDVADERRRVDHVVERLNAEFRGRVHIETIRWETSYYSAHDTFQKQIPEAADCDVVVAIFGSRLGTPLPQGFPNLPTGEPYPSGTAYEVLSAIEVRKSGRGVPDVYVFRKAGAPLIMLDAPERADVEVQWSRLKVFFERWFHTAGGEFIAAFADFSTTDEFAAKVEDCLRQWLQKSGFSVADTTWDRILRGSPFPGLPAFGETHARVFFGRDLAVSQSLARLREAGTRPGRMPFLLMIGASGSGKSSLLRAGLLPRLQLPGTIPEVDLWRLAIMTPGEDPFQSLAESLFADGAIGTELRSGSFRTREILAKQLAVDPALALAPIRDALTLAAEKRRADAHFDAVRPARLALAIDQGERLFSAQSSIVDRFGELLTAMVRDNLAYVIFVLRSDTYAHFQRHDALVALREVGATFDLVPPTQSELEDIVIHPVALCRPPLEFAQRNGISLAMQLVTDAKGGDALPLLQMTLARLYAAEAARGDGVLQFNDYRGMDAAVSETANEALEVVGAAARAELPALITRLVTNIAQDPVTGANVPIITPIDKEAFEAISPARQALVEAFVAKRLLSSEGDGAQQRIRPVHEALLRIWPEAVSIVTEAGNLIRVRHTLAPIVDAWTSAPADEKSRHLDISPALLSGAETLVKRFGQDLGPEMRAFIAASGAVANARAMRERDEQERRVRDAEALAAANRRTAQRTGAGLVLATVLAGVALWQWHLAQGQRTIAETERDRAENALKASIDAANGMVFDLGQKYKNAIGVPKTTIKDILQQAIELQGKLTDSGETSPALKFSEIGALTETSNVLVQLGEATEALAAAQKAKSIANQMLQATPGDVDLQRSLFVANTKIGAAAILLGKLPDAMAAYQGAADIANRLLTSDPGTFSRRRDLSAAYDGIGRVYTEEEDPKNALIAFQKGLDLASDLAKADPNDANAAEDLSVAYAQVGMAQQALSNLTAAESALLASRQIAEARAKANPDDIPAQTDLGVALFRLGDLQFKERHFDDALQSYQMSLPIFQRLADADPLDLEMQRDLATNYSHLGDAFIGLGRSLDAQASYDRNLAISKQLVAATPANTIWQRDLTVAYGKVGDLLLAAGDAAGALADYQAAQPITELLLKSDPARELWLADRAFLLGRVGDAFVKLSKSAEAEAAYRESLGVRQSLAATYADDLAKQHDVMVAQTRLGDFLSGLNRAADALIAYQAVEATCTRVVTADPNNSIWQRDLAVAINKIASLNLTTGKSADALAGFQTALQIELALAKLDAKNGQAQADLAFSYGRIGDSFMQLKRYSAALQSYSACENIQKTYIATAPDNLDAARELAVTENKIASALAADSKLAEAVQVYGGSLDIMSRLVTANPANTNWGNDLEYTFQQLGITGSMMLRSRDFAGALAAADLALTHTGAPVWINLLKANALMFLGRADEAKAVHTQWRGAKLYGEMLWPDGVASNFAELKSLGLGSPVMDDILASFAGTK